MMKNEQKPKVVIYEGRRWDYFKWFILGFYELEKSGKINFKFKPSLPDRLLVLFNNEFLLKVINKLLNLTCHDSYNMKGYVDYGNGIKKHFVIDSADTTYMFNSSDLINSVIYFKMQCPKNLNDIGFRLTSAVSLPWIDQFYEDGSICKPKKTSLHKILSNFPQLKHKIRPLMIGPRRLSVGLSYKCLKSGYDNYIKDRNINKDMLAMCYFGNALGPKPCNINTVPDLDREAQIIAFFGNKVSHPNEKRARVAEMLSKMEDCDSRIISSSNADNGMIENRELVIPIKDFCKHISKFKYNINVSGYRMSIPNRFIESFMVGTGIVTDELSVKWYRPFGSEVFETVKMGYEPMDKVDWDKFRSDLSQLPDLDSKCVVDSFNEKWAPHVVAQYIIDTVENA